MKSLSLVTAAALLCSVPALAEEAPETRRPETQTRAPLSVEEARARAAVGSALESEAGTQATPPTLPEEASDRARQAHAETAFGKKGAEAREAAQQAAEAGKQQAQAAREAAAARASERGPGASRGAEGESRAAAVRERATQAGSTSGVVPSRPAPAPATGRR